ncbi:OLC1v1025687C1 [Oldenlandia corymbosa var. corymbosa]|uniref:OLC1v1025687C1 n=1 Tax=Oldenlandia corymbosa var. corymbosa TaxID=529605 RepID=A0AAV1C5Q5_OLDCO|nr:OLC1v1025687C1 [Oldenlandia corymbosa var. corymbosa]
MTANMDIVMPRCLSFMETDYFERPLASKSCNTSKDWTSKHNLSGLISMSATKCEFLRMKSPQASRSSWRTAFALNTGGLPENNQESFDNSGSGLGATRLGRIVGAAGRQLLEKLSSARKNFPMKVFLLLLGFYTANALATILGQTGDWDVLVAGIVVTAIEGIGMLMYRKPNPVSGGRLQSLVVMINYWKAGVCLGLFVDAFKLGS